jgi:ribonuclease HI
MTRALRTTATDMLEAHANLLPLDLRIQNLCHQAAVRLASHPTSHPISPLLRRASKGYVKRHKSSLHHLTHAYNLKPDTIEKIYLAQRQPNDKSPHNSRIAKSREASICLHDKQLHGTWVYTDGSGLNGNIGAAAVLYRPNSSTAMLRYHLGTIQQHTVYESEAVGLLLAAQLLLEEQDIVKPVSIFVDNQATIKSSDVFQTKPGHYLIDLFHTNARRMLKTHHLNKCDLTLCWISGHSGIEGNEKADEEARLASTRPEHNSADHLLPDPLNKGPLPLSVPASLQSQRETTKVRWTTKLSESPCLLHMNRIDPKLPSSSYLKLTALMNKRQTAILMWLHTGHCPLNQYLKCITKSPSDKCIHCPETPEMVIHYLLRCPLYTRQRHALKNKVGNCTFNIPHLLSSKHATPHLLTYIEQMGHLKASLGKPPTQS